MNSRILALLCSLGLTLLIAPAEAFQNPSQTQSAETEKKSSQSADSPKDNATKDDSAKTKPVGDGAPATPEKTDGETPAEPKKADSKQPKIERATFGGGCFWCTEAVFERIPGVKDVVSGYAGGNVPNPTYQDVCTGLTGHAEVIQVIFDPSVVTFESLLKLFFKSHDPTTLNSQGPDFGTQYRSIILFESEDQKQTALKVYKELTTAKAFKKPIVTQLVPLTAFYPAEAYHQNYYQFHSDADYSQIYIAPS